MLFFPTKQEVLNFLHKIIISLFFYLRIYIAFSTTVGSTTIASEFLDQTNVVRFNEEEWLQNSKHIGQDENIKSNKTRIQNTIPILVLNWFTIESTFLFIFQISFHSYFSANPEGSRAQYCIRSKFQNRQKSFFVRSTTIRAQKMVWDYVNVMHLYMRCVFVCACHW